MVLPTPLGALLRCLFLGRVSYQLNGKQFFGEASWVTRRHPTQQNHRGDGGYEPEPLPTAAGHSDQPLRECAEAGEPCNQQPQSVRRLRLAWWSAPAAHGN